VPDLERKTLSDRVTGPQPSGRGAWFMLAFCLPFLAFGLGWTIWTAGGGLTGPWSPFGVPFGAVFLGAGLLLAATAVRGIVRGGRRRAMLSSRPDEPWLADHPWDPQGADDEQPRRLTQTGAFVAMWWLILGGVQYGFLASGWGSGRFGICTMIPVAAVLVVMNAAGVGLVVWWLRDLLRRLRHGRSTVRFAHFPYLLGGPAEMAVSIPADLSDCPQVACTLRCVEETMERDRDGQAQVTAWQVWADTQTVEWDRPFGRGEELRLRFDLPEGDYETRLSGTPRRYWELEITGRRPGPDYKATFLLPVYADPRGPEDRPRG